VQRADHAVEQGELRHLAPRHREDAADQQGLDVLAALRGPVHHQHRGRRRDRVDDADDGLLRDRRAVHAAGREERGPAHRESQRVPVGRAALDGMAGQEGHADAERRHLREGEVHEDDTAGQHVQPEIDVDTGEDEASEEGQPEEVEHQRAAGAAASAAARRATLTSKSER
jgi:hypothetical protein